MDSAGSVYKVVLVTAPVKEAEEIGRSIVENRLAACVNIIEKIKSIYWWEEKVCADSEALLVFKTSKEKIRFLIDQVKKIHSYDVPEIIVLPIEYGNQDYLNWIDESVK